MNESTIVCSALLMTWKQLNLSSLSGWNWNSETNDRTIKAQKVNWNRMKMSNQIKRKWIFLSLMTMCLVYFRLVHCQWQYKASLLRLLASDKHRRKENRKGFQLLNLFAVFARDSITFFFVLLFTNLRQKREDERSEKKLERQSTRNKQSPMVLDINVPCSTLKTVTVDCLPFFLSFSKKSLFFFCAMCHSLFYYTTLCCTNSVTGVAPSDMRLKVCSIVVILINKGFFSLLLLLSQRE